MEGDGFECKLRMDGNLQKTIVYGQISIWEFGVKEGNKTERSLSHICIMLLAVGAYIERSHILLVCSSMERVGILGCLVFVVD
jgi:hypothetical protein